MQLLHAQRLHDPTPGRYAAPSLLANGVMPHGRGAPNRICPIMFWNMFWNSSGTALEHRAILAAAAVRCSHDWVSTLRHHPSVRRYERRLLSPVSCACASCFCCIISFQPVSTASGCSVVRGSCRCCVRVAVATPLLLYGHLSTSHSSLKNPLPTPTAEKSPALPHPLCYHQQSTPCVTRHTSNVTRHTSHATRHTPRVTRLTQQQSMTPIKIIYWIYYG